MTLSGCSIVMALSGHQEPNFEAFDVGSTRRQVEIQLGGPVASETLANGTRLEIYRYEMGNSPNGHRALMNFYIDLVTIFLYELPGTIIEARMGYWEESKILYDRDDRVLEITGYKPPPPSPALKEAIDAHKQYERKPP
jgi:hypothetical protein